MHNVNNAPACCSFWENNYGVLFSLISWLIMRIEPFMGRKIHDCDEITTQKFLPPTFGSIRFRGGAAQLSANTSTMTVGNVNRTRLGRIVEDFHFEFAVLALLFRFSFHLFQLEKTVIYHSNACQILQNKDFISVFQYSNIKRDHPPRTYMLPACGCLLSFEINHEN